MTPSQKPLFKGKSTRHSSESHAPIIFQGIRGDGVIISQGIRGDGVIKWGGGGTL